MPDFKGLNLQDIKGIIFDLDGTLYQMRWYMRPLLTYKIVPHCLRLPRFLKIRQTFAGIEMDNRDSLMRAICERMASRENRSPDEIYNWIMNRFYPSFVSIMSYFKHSRPGLNETISLLRTNKYKLAVLSDYEKVVERLEKLEINSSNFDLMTSSELYGALKPSPRPLLHIANTWGLKPEEILVIGDRDDTDGKASRDARMRFLQISDKKNQNASTYTWTQVSTILRSVS